MEVPLALESSVELARDEGGAYQSWMKAALAWKLLGSPRKNDDTRCWQLLWAARTRIALVWLTGDN